MVLGLNLLGFSKGGTIVCLIKYKFDLALTFDWVKIKTHLFMGAPSLIHISGSIYEKDQGSYPVS